MSTSAVSANSSGAVHGFHHHHRSGSASGASASTSQNDDLLASQPSGTTTAGSGTSAASGTTDSSASTGLQKFAAELQSILISAQSGQQNGTATTASDPGTAADPSGASDPTAPPNPAGRQIRHLADRLQDLLSTAGGNGNGATSSSAAASSANGNQPLSLQSVLDKLQSTLQQTLQSYGTAASATSTTNLTA